MQNRREFLQLLSAAAGVGLVLPQINFAQTNSTDAWKTEYPKILARIKPPKFPKLILTTRKERKADLRRS